MGGRSGYLPDISSKFNFFLQMAVNSQREKDYNSSASGLYNMNALLGEKYVININDRQFKDSVEKESTYRCNNEKCTMIKSTITLDENNEEQKSKQTVRNEVPQSQVRVYSLITPMIESILSKETTTSYWNCPKCKTQNKLIDTTIYQPSISQPSFRRVVPTCPPRGLGVSTRLGYTQKFDEWFYHFLEQLSHQLALYRIEYINLNRVDMAEGTTFADTGDRV